MKNVQLASFLQKIFRSRPKKLTVFKLVEERVPKNETIVGDDLRFVIFCLYCFFLNTFLFVSLFFCLFILFS